MENGPATEKRKGRPGFGLALLLLIIFIVLVFIVVDTYYRLPEKVGKPETPMTPLKKADSSDAPTVTFEELLRATIDTLAASKLEDFYLSDRQDTLLAGVQITPAKNVAAEGWRLWVILKYRLGFDLQFATTLNTTESIREVRKRIAQDISQFTGRVVPLLRLRADFSTPANLVLFAKNAHDLRPYAVNPSAFQRWNREFIEARLHKVIGETTVINFSLRPQELMAFHRHLNAIDRGLGDLVVHKCLAALCRLPVSSPRLTSERWQLLKAADFLRTGHGQTPRDYRTLFQLWGRFMAAKLNVVKPFEATNTGFPAGQFSEKPKILPAHNSVTVAPGFSIDAVYKIQPALNWQKAADAYFSAIPFWAAATEKLGVMLRGNPNRGARAKLFFRDNEAVFLSQVLQPSENNLIAAVTGTYTSPDTTVVGLAYHQGELIGGLVQEWGGFCLIAKTGRLHIVDWHDLDLTRAAAALQIAQAKDTSAALPRALKIFSRPEDYATFIGFIEKHQLSVIQGHLLLHRRQIAVNEGGELFSRRLLAQFENGDFGVIDLQGTDFNQRRKTFTLAEAAAIAQALNASEAMNLDMGTWNWGVLKMGPRQVELGAPLKAVENRLTNALILYTEKEPTWE